MLFDLQIWPTDSAFAIGIIVFLIVLFLIWISCWFLLTRRISYSQRDLDKAGIVAGQLIEEAFRLDREGTFSAESVCNEVLSDCSESIGKHIRTIFLSGQRDGSLDLGELNRLTSGSVLRLEPVLRSLLATFVIVGLLGTLFGIARAVAVFGGDEPTAKDLLQRLPGAFTPSIWGVTFSIVGSLMLVWTRSAISGFANNLRAKTVEVLIPKLLPSNSERLENSARRAIEAADRVTRFAESIDGKSAEMDASLQRAASFAKPISTSMQEMSTNVQSGAVRVDVTFGNLTEKIRVFSEALDRFAAYRTALEVREARLDGLLESFKNAAEGNVAVSNGISQFLLEKTNDLLSATREMYKPVSDSAEKIKEISALFTVNLGELTEKQTGVLESQFSSWRAELNTGAETAKKSLDNLKAPFQESAVELRQQAASSIQQMSTLIRDLKTHGDILNNSLSKVTAGLRELAAKDASAEPASEFPYGKFDARMKTLDSRLGGLDDAIRRLASARNQGPGFWSRLFHRKSTAL